MGGFYSCKPKNHNMIYFDKIVVITNLRLKSFAFSPSFYVFLYNPIGIFTSGSYHTPNIRWAKFGWIPTLKKNRIIIFIKVILKGKY